MPFCCGWLYLYVLYFKPCCPSSIVFVLFAVLENKCMQSLGRAATNELWGKTSCLQLPQDTKIGVNRFLRPLRLVQYHLYMSGLFSRCQRVDVAREDIVITFYVFVSDQQCTRKYAGGSRLPNWGPTPPSCPLPYSSLLFPLPSPSLPLEVGTLNTARRSGGAL